MPSPQGMATRLGSQPLLSEGVDATEVVAGGATAPASPFPAGASVVAEAALVNDHEESATMADVEEAAASVVNEAVAMEDICEAGTVAELGVRMLA